MITKILELRDKGTFIPVIAIKMTPKAPFETKYDEVFCARAYLLGRCGYSPDGNTVLFMRADGSGNVRSDPYEWGGRTYQTAHLWLESHFDELKDGDVICVETILGERTTPKISERFGG